MTHELQELVNEASKVATDENADLFNLLNEIEKLASKHQLLPKQTPPEEKPKRRRWWVEYLNNGDDRGFNARIHFKCPDGANTPMLEILPGDPDDLDVLLREIDAEIRGGPEGLRRWAQNVLYARSTYGDVCDQTPPETPYSDGPMGHIPNVLPEKPKRRRFRAFTEGVDSLEILPGDPPDLDALLAAIDEPWDGVLSTREKIKRIEAARHGKGGDAVSWKCMNLPCGEPGGCSEHCGASECVWYGEGGEG